jgi:hypothetical protein
VSSSGPTTLTMGWRDFTRLYDWSLHCFSLDLSRAIHCKIECCSVSLSNSNSFIPCYSMEYLGDAFRISLLDTNDWSTTKVKSPFPSKSFFVEVREIFLKLSTNVQPVKVNLRFWYLFETQCSRLFSRSRSKRDSQPVHFKEKAFYRSLNGSSPGHTGRSFIDSVYTSFRKTPSQESQNEGSVRKMP